ncbi:hypothetical protein GCM10008935_05390 [Alkalibacillus silvisoli]|uniref:Uncharacterized protein n=1 Tax=Alkalibacillus silvisoli TaxID=392823 RepID=A0ABP3JL03_9BACI
MALPSINEVVAVTIKIKKSKMNIRLYGVARYTMRFPPHVTTYSHININSLTVEFLVKKF